MASTGDSTPDQPAQVVQAAAFRPHGLPRSVVAHPRYGPLPGLLLILTVQKVYFLLLSGFGRPAFWPYGPSGQ